FDEAGTAADPAIGRRMTSGAELAAGGQSQASELPISRGADAEAVAEGSPVRAAVRAQFKGHLGDFRATAAPRPTDRGGAGGGEGLRRWVVKKARKTQARDGRGSAIGLEGAEHASEKHL